MMYQLLFKPFQRNLPYGKDLVKGYRNDKK